MHKFSDLINLCTFYTLSSLERTNNEIIDALQKRGSTTLVKTLQMVQLQKAIFLVGMFSMFEADLQTNLDCSDGFNKLREVLKNEGEMQLLEKFNDITLAVNVLKHGLGKSYDKLVTKADSLEFNIKLQGKTFFDEGDVSEPSTLIEVDEKFVKYCVYIIQQVSDVIDRYRAAPLGE